MEADPVDDEAAALEVADAVAELRVMVRVDVQLDEAEATYVALAEEVAEVATWVLATTEEVAAADEVATAEEAAEDEPELLPAPDPPTVKSTQDSYVWLTLAASHQC